MNINEKKNFYHDIILFYFLYLYFITLIILFIRFKKYLKKKVDLFTSGMKNIINMIMYFSLQLFYCAYNLLFYAFHRVSNFHLVLLSIDSNTTSTRFYSLSFLGTIKVKYQTLLSYFNL